MPTATFTKLVDRFNTDEAFRDQAISDPETALKGYDLPADEREALISGDSDRLQALGVDARDQKACY